MYELVLTYSYPVKCAVGKVDIYILLTYNINIQLLMDLLIIRNILILLLGVTVHTFKNFLVVASLI